MNCNEARRRLLGPEGGVEQDAALHVAQCTPCRLEVEALGEVDRRMQMLGNYHLLSAPTLLPQLDRQLQHLQGQRASKRSLRPGMYLVWATVVAFMGAVALWLLRL